MKQKITLFNLLRHSGCYITTRRWSKSPYILHAGCVKHVMKFLALSVTSQVQHTQ